MREVIKMFLTFAFGFWLIVAHWLTAYLIDLNIKASIIAGLLIVHLDMFLIATFLAGYKKSQELEGEE